jgi:Ca2+-binding EF-hand superfamily protein
LFPGRRCAPLKCRCVTLRVQMRSARGKRHHVEVKQIRTETGRSILKYALCRNYAVDHLPPIIPSPNDLPPVDRACYRKARCSPTSSGTSWLPPASQSRFEPGEYDGHFVWGGSPNFPELLARILDEDIKSSLDDHNRENEALPFVRDVGHTDVHFLEGFLGRSDITASTRKQSKGLLKKILISRKNRTEKRATLQNGQHIVANREDAKKMINAIERQARRPSMHVETVITTEKSFWKREACESLRILVFGEVGNENTPLTLKDIYAQSMGSMEDVAKFVDFWLQIDEDDSGDIDFDEFLEFFAKSKHDRLLCMKCVKFLLGSDARNSIATGSRKGKRGTCTRDDIMKLLWLQAKPKDLEVMNQMFDLHRTMGARVKTPPMLPDKKRKQLLGNFNFLDRNSTLGQQGLITYQDMMEAGFIDSEMMEELRAKHDQNGQGVINEQDFLEMLCPYGCRAHEDIKEMINKDDMQIRLVYLDARQLDTGFDWGKCWLLDSDFQWLKANSSLKFRFPPCRSKSKENCAEDRKSRFLTLDPTVATQ